MDKPNFDFIFADTKKEIETLYTLWEERGSSDDGSDASVIMHELNNWVIPQLEGAWEDAQDEIDELKELVSSLEEELREAKCEIDSLNNYIESREGD